MAESGDAIGDLADAEEAYERHGGRIDEVGAERVETTVAAYRDLLILLDRYEGRATGTGDFGAFIEFQEKLAELVEGLPEDAPRRDAFETVASALDKRRVSEADFERARETLSPAADLAGTVEARAAALADYREARKRVARRLDEVESRLADLDRLRELGDAYLAIAEEDDPEALLAEIRDPVEAYNGAVESAFRGLKREAPARRVLAFVADADGPFVDYRPPPADLREYLDSNDAGEHPIPKLVEYADYSPKKLEHYVDEPMELKRRVATHRIYLERLDAGPLTLDWPPGPPAELRYRADELVSVVDAFAPPEAIQRLRTVRDLTRDEAWFARLADAAEARERLGSRELARLEGGELDAERERAENERGALRDALAEHPER